MARTPQATRIMIDPVFSDGYESNHSGELGGQSLGIADIQSPFDLTSRTPTHIRFAEAEQSQLAVHPAAGRLNRESESSSSQRTAISDMAEEISRLRSEISEMRRSSPVGEILNHRSGGETDFRMDSSGPIAQEESLVAAPVGLRSQQIVEASPTIRQSYSTNIFIIYQRMKNLLLYRMQ